MKRPYEYQDCWSREEFKEYLRLGWKLHVFCQHRKTKMTQFVVRRPL